MDNLVQEFIRQMVTFHVGYLRKGFNEDYHRRSLKNYQKMCIHPPAHIYEGGCTICGKEIEEMRKDVTVTCEVCGKERKLHEIEYKIVDNSHLFNAPHGTITESIAFCKFSPSCDMGANFKSHVSILSGCPPAGGGVGD